MFYTWIVKCIKWCGSERQLISCEDRPVYGRWQELLLLPTFVCLCCFVGTRLYSLHEN